MSVDQSFAVAMHAMSVMAFSDPERVGTRFVADQIDVHPVAIRRTLGKLVHSGLVNSTPGPKGGYRLALAAKKINLWDIYSSIHASGFANRNALPSASCKEGQQIERVLVKLYADADKALEREFRKTTLADILRRALKV